jgi:tyrosinase
MEAIIRRDVPTSRRTAWENAAREWRLPYWDWAAKQGYINNYGLPEVFTMDRIEIVDFADNNPPTTVNIANPLWKFSNPVGVAMGHRSMGVFRLRGFPVRALFVKHLKIRRSSLLVVE